MNNIKIYSNGCDWCLDPDGYPTMPDYGPPPHRHVFKNIEGVGEGIATINRPDLFDHKSMTLDEDGMCTYYCITEGCPNSKVKQEKIWPSTNINGVK